MQQHLPFTVLKRAVTCCNHFVETRVATALTVYGIETHTIAAVATVTIATVATALTVYGIETSNECFILDTFIQVATALTVYGIETSNY